MTEIQIYTEIGPHGGPGSATGIAAALAAANGDDVAIRINSGGGNVFEGVAIYEQIKRYKGRTVATIDGVAASAASVIAMAADEVEITDAGFLMIHESDANAHGGASDLKRGGELLASIDANMAAIYAARSGKPTAEIVELMHVTTWFTAAEAVEFGLADRIVTGMAAAAYDGDLSRYAHVPRALIQHQETRMNFQIVARALGLSATAGADEITAAATKVMARNAELEAEKTAISEALLAAQLEAKQASGEAIIARLRDDGLLITGSMAEELMLELHREGDVTNLERQARMIREFGGAARVPTGARQSTDTNRASSGSLAAPPLTARGEIDYEAIAAALPDDRRMRYAPEARANSWKSVLSQPGSTFLWEAAGFQRGGGR